MTIHTKWHKVVETILAVTNKNGHYSIIGAQGSSEVTDQETKSLLEITAVVNNQPKFWVDNELIDMMGREDVVVSLAALHDAGVARLPFPSMLVEWEGTHYHYMVWLSERDLGEDKYPFAAIPFWWDRRRDELQLSPAFVKMRLDRDPGNHNNQLCVVFDGGACPYVPDAATLELNQHREWEETVTMSAGTALEAALLLLNTRGVVKEVVEVQRLNKARARSGKPSIPQHTIIRVGHVYKRDGSTTGVTSTGRRMPIHWRRAHTRQQKIGKNWAQTKIVYIPPVLVNYSGEGEPQAKIPNIEVRV